VKYVLTIAGSDSGGGAGIQADIKTITSLGAHALTAVTAVTAQNSLGVKAIHEMPEGIISQQVETVVEDVFPNAVKTGMLPSQNAAKETARLIKEKGLKKVVIDPVLKASTGRGLIDFSAINLFKKSLFPLADIITPNLEEAGVFSGIKVDSLEDMEKAAREIKLLGPDVVVTGGHLKGEECVDLLYDGKKVYYFRGLKLDILNSHGSGCVFSASLATFLAMDHDLVEATRLAHDFTRRAIEEGYPCGGGVGVVNPASIWDKGI
jgi:hydroxymethylpyrimidine/phosphomethylpyrimidine kinase